MLKSWSLENFKSIGARVDIELAPLTIFAGANSSGKSTILQSILLLKQTAQYAPINRPLALNGPILKLGRFDDVLHASARDARIKIGFQLDIDYSPQVISNKPLEVRSRIFSRSLESFESLRFEADFEVSDPKLELAQLQPQLNFVSLSIEPKPEVYLEFLEHSGGEVEEIEVEQKPGNTFTTLKNKNRTSLSTDSNGKETENIQREQRIKYDVTKLDEDSRHEALDSLSNAEIMGATTLHFMPYSFEVEYDAALTDAKNAAEEICLLSSSARRRHKNDDYKIAGSIVSELLDYLRTQLSENDLFDRAAEPLDSQIESERKFSVRDVIKLIHDHFGGKGLRHSPSLGSFSRMRYGLLSDPNIRVTRAAMQDYQETLTNKLTENAKPRKEKMQFTSGSIGDSAQYVRALFARTIKYLGPLRDEPKPLYPLEALVNPLDIGYRGEHTAAVLELNRNRTVEFVNPKSIESGNTPQFSQSESLHDAAQIWLSYLGVAEDVATSDKGKFGHEMQVKTKGVEKTHDLTNVGVGVSQVLPIIIMALLADEDSLLIFEQPELHLHPLVQSRLADFFICLTLQGKQCLIETHSEYLIKRLRRRTAEFDGETLARLTRIYFVERENGVSSYKPINLNAYGSVSEWPKDFFDQSDKEIEKIIEAATRKKLLS